MLNVVIEVTSYYVCCDRCGPRSQSSGDHLTVGCEDQGDVLDRSRDDCSIYENQGDVLGRSRDDCLICAGVSALIFPTPIPLLSSL
jgi:hypothetical protein